MSSARQVYLEPKAVSTAPARVEKPKLKDFKEHDTKAVINWNGNCPYEWFKIRWWIDGGEIREVTSVVSSYTLTNLRHGCRYNAQIAAIISCDGAELQGPYSEILTFGTAPRAPRDLQIFPGLKEPQTSVIVKFMDDDSTMSYVIFWRSSSDGEIKQLQANQCFANIDGLTPGDQYDIWVTATARSGNEKAELISSKPCCLQTPIQTYPAKITELFVKKTSVTSVTVFWKKVFGADRYHVEWKRSDRDFQLKTTTDTQITLKNLDHGYVYNVCVAAENAAGMGDYCDVDEFETDLAPPTTIVANIIRSGDHLCMEVKFSALAQEQLKEYVVELAGEEPRIQKTKIHHAIFVRLCHGVCYFPCVHAVSENGVESRRAYGEPKWTCPAQVAGVISKPVSKDSEKISWNEVDGAEFYVIKVHEEGKEPEPDQEVTETAITLSDLALNAKFSVSVTAENKGGRGKSSKTHSFQTALNVPGMINVSCIHSYRESALLVSWDRCDGATEYHVDMTEVETNRTKPRQTTQNCFYEFYDLKPGCQYKASVRAIAGNEERNSAIKFSKPVWTHCSKIEEVYATFVSPSTFSIGWSDCPGAKEYKVIYETGHGARKENTTETNHLTLTSLPLGQTFTFTVHPVNEAGHGKKSDPKTFKTGMPPPSDALVQNDATNPHSAIKVTFTEPKNKPAKYRIKAAPLSGDGQSQEKEINVSHCTMSNLDPGTEYVVYVSSVDNDNEQYNSEAVRSDIIWTAPGKVTGIEAIKDSPNSQNVKWDPAIGASSYEVKVKKSGSPPVWKNAERNEIHLDDLVSHSKYTLSVRAKNAGGYSQESEELHFETALHAPRNIKVTNNARNPTTAFDIEFDEPETAANRYRIRIINLSGREDKTQTVDRQQALSIITVNDLEPGNSYQLAVSSLHDTDENLNSEEIKSSPIWTGTLTLTVQIEYISNDTRKVTWDRVSSISKYDVKWRVEHQEWDKRQTIANEMIIKNLIPGCNYEVKVIAINMDGVEQEPGSASFTTAPATPVNLDKSILSTRNILLTCDETCGATHYIFDINGQIFESIKPEYTLKHGTETSSFTFRVAAKNHAGQSQSSEALEFRQTLLHVQKKFTQLAKSKLEKGQFLKPTLEEIPSADVANDFGTNDFNIGKGETVLVEGSHFTGKTACCSYFLQNIPPEKLCIFLDFDDYRNLTQKFDVKELLQRKMTDLSPEEMEFVFRWMKNNSEQVVLVVDNLTIPSSFSGKQISYASKELPSHILYYLVTTNRVIFPMSQVFCTAAQLDLRQLLHPTRTLRIIGFDDGQVKKLKKNILKENSEIDVPEQLGYFCKNPGFSEVVFRLMKSNDRDVDLTSYASVLVQLLYESVGRYPETKRREKLATILGEVKEVPQKLYITPSLNPEKPPKQSLDPKLSRSTSVKSVRSFIGHTDGNGQKKFSCETLHDVITKALYFALCCPLKEFKQRFHKKSIKLGRNAKIWIIATGLLRQQTLKRAMELFNSNVGELNVKEAPEKCNFVKKFFKDQLNLILQQIDREPQIVQDWFTIAKELNDENLIKKCELKITVSKSTSTDQSDFVVN